MPITVTVDEAIAQAVKTRVAAVSNVTAVRVRRDPDSWTPVDRQVIITKRSAVRQPSLDYPGNPPAIAYQVRINLRLHVFQSERDESNDKEVQIGEFVAAVMAGVTNASSWYQWGGLAINTTFGDIEYLPNDGGFDCAVVPLIIDYRFSEDDPLEVRA